MDESASEAGTDGGSSASGAYSLYHQMKDAAAAMQQAGTAFLNPRRQRENHDDFETASSASSVGGLGLTDPEVPYEPPPRSWRSSITAMMPMVPAASMLLGAPSASPAMASPRSVSSAGQPVATGGATDLSRVDEESFSDQDGGSSDGDDEAAFDIVAGEGVGKLGLHFSKLPPAPWLEVRRVDPDTWAAGQDLQAGDIVVAANGLCLDAIPREQFLEMMKARPLRLTVVEGGRSMLYNEEHLSAAQSAAGVPAIKVSGARSDGHNGSGSSTKSFSARLSREPRPPTPPRKSTDARSPRTSATRSPRDSTGAGRASGDSAARREGFGGGRASGDSTGPREVAGGGRASGDSTGPREDAGGGRASGDSSGSAESKHLAVRDELEDATSAEVSTGAAAEAASPAPNAAPQESPPRLPESSTGATATAAAATAVAAVAATASAASAAGEVQAATEPREQVQIGTAKVTVKAAAKAADASEKEEPSDSERSVSSTSSPSRGGSEAPVLWTEDEASPASRAKQAVRTETFSLAEGEGRMSRMNSGERSYSIAGIYDALDFTETFAGGSSIVGPSAPRCSMTMTNISAVKEEEEPSCATTATDSCERPVSLEEGDEAETW
eukprot:TRINITY_DN5290_c0_g1_i1.p1 TRINITY_DN5290_c0_g1~~TRINITY_DN5290_c0_g1_i1.p1  ORF type:complete len:614 (+),score=140.26 TRINITY_DN5290_c0_g1_i1:162-2003(+)